MFKLYYIILYITYTSIIHVKINTVFISAWSSKSMNFSVIGDALSYRVYFVEAEMQHRKYFSYQHQT